jgi:transposase
MPTPARSTRTDARTLEPADREKLRRKALRLHKSGHSHEQIAVTLDVRRSTVSVWLKRGSAGLGTSEGKRGRPTGTGRLLSQEQEGRIQRDIVECTPDQLGFSFRLWSTKAIHSYIKERFGIEMQMRLVLKYLKRWGLTLKSTPKRNPEQQSDAVKEWMRSDYPRVANMAKAVGREIYWVEETAVSLAGHDSRGCGLGCQDSAYVPSQHEQDDIHLVSAVSNRGAKRFMALRERMTAETLIRLMGCLLKDASRKIFLILPSHWVVQDRRQIRNWAAEHWQHIQVEFLPNSCT